MDQMDKNTVPAKDQLKDQNCIRFFNTAGTGKRIMFVVYFKKQIKRALSRYDFAYVLPLPEMSENKGKDCSILLNKKIKFIETIQDIKIPFERTKKYSISLMSSKPFNYEIEYLKSKL